LGFFKVFGGGIANGNGNGNGGGNGGGNGVCNTLLQISMILVLVTKCFKNCNSSNLFIF